MTAIWIDESNCDVRHDEVGFLVESYIPGHASTWSLQNEPVRDSAAPVLFGTQNPIWNDRHRDAHGLARVARVARTTGRICLARVPATAELLEQLGYPELSSELPPPPPADRPRVVQLYLDQLSEVAGLEFRQADGSAPTEDQLRRAYALAASYHEAVAEQRGARQCPGGRWPTCEGRLED